MTLEGEDHVSVRMLSVLAQHPAVGLTSAVAESLATAPALVAEPARRDGQEFTLDSTTEHESVESDAMASKRSVRRSALVLGFLVVGTALGSATAMAAELSDYRWASRPLVVFAPTASDPRLVETLNRIEATQCDFDSRDMVIGQVVTEGNSTLDGHAVDTEETRRLKDQFAIGENAFTVVLIGKDGGEKLRVDDVPDLRRIYAVVDGMPMRNREMGADPGPC